VSLLERIRRFLLPAPGDDRPLSEQEQDEDRLAPADDQRLRVLDDFLGRLGRNARSG
jgi:hypothetical protein